MRLFLALALLAASTAAAAQPQELTAQSVCRDGKLVGLHVLVPHAGVWTFEIPPDVCAVAKPAEQPPAAPPRPERPTRAPNST